MQHTATGGRLRELELLLGPALLGFEAFQVGLRLAHRQLENRRDLQYFEPGNEGRWFETHGFGPDDSWIYFSGSVMDTGVLQSDIARLTLATGELERLTFSAGPKAGEPGGHEEHASFTKRFDTFSHLSSEAGRGREEIWLASPDGSARRQLTRFNEPGSSDHELVDGLSSMPSDNAWNPRPPSGREQLLVYVQVDFNPFENVAPRNEIFLIELTRPDTDGERGPSGTEEEPPPPGGPHAGPATESGSGGVDEPRPGCRQLSLRARSPSSSR